MDWTPLDLKNLAALFDDMADALLAFRKQNGDNLSPTAKRQLTTDFGLLIAAGESLEHLAVAGALKDVDSDVKDLQSATHDAIAALQTITDVQKAMSIAVAAVALAAAIAAPSPGTIAGALGVLVNGVKDAIAPAPDPAAAKPKTS
jgi:hypothetical protein